ncbi:unnamed protein product [Amaranthus hypochondriacus]
MADNKDPSEPEKSPTSIKRNPSETAMEESSEEPTTRVQRNPSETTMEESSEEPTRVLPIPLSRKTPVRRQPSKTPPKSPRITVRLPEVVHLSVEKSSKEPKKKSPTIIKRNSGSLTMEDSPREPKKKKTVHNPDFNAGDDDDDEDDDDDCTSD